MRNWSAGYNFLYREGHIYLEEGPWWLFLIRSIDRLCDAIPHIPLPPIPYRIDEEDDNTGKLTGRKVWTNLHKEWNNLHSLFHCKVCHHIYCWADDKITDRLIDAPMDQVQELFYANSKYSNREDDEKERDIWIASIREESGVDLSGLDRFSYRELEAMKLFANKLKIVHGAAIQEFYRSDTGALWVDVNFQPENRWEATGEAAEISHDVDAATGIFIHLG